MRFDTVAIVGVGLIGGSIGLGLKRRRLARQVIGVGRSASSLNEARRLGAIDHATTHLRRGVAQAELAVFCTPVDRIADQAREAAEHCPPHAVFTDAGSTKAHIVARVEAELPDGVSFVGSHPLAGSEKTGVAAARANLFDGRVCVVTETPRTPAQPLGVVEAFWRSLGARVIRMSPEAHDRAVAYTSHLAHLAAAALAITLPRKYDAVVASGFRDTTRIAASDPGLWTAIFLDNSQSLQEALEAYEKTLRRFRDALMRRDERRVRTLWEKSQRKRQRLNTAE